MKANDRQVGGSHYRDQAMEHWDLIIQLRIPYMEAQIIKYVSRWRQKGGIQDLDKAEHFLQKLIETTNSPNVFLLLGSCWRSLTGVLETRERAVQHYIDVNGIPLHEARIIKYVSHWKDWDGIGSLHAAMESFGPLRKQAYIEKNWVDSGDPQPHGYVDQDGGSDGPR